MKKSRVILDCSFAGLSQIKITLHVELGADLHQAWPTAFAKKGHFPTTKTSDYGIPLRTWSYYTGTRLIRTPKAHPKLSLLSGCPALRINVSDTKTFGLK